MFKESERKGRSDDIDKRVSLKLKMRRIMLGLSQKDLSKAVDVSIQQVQKYEKATNRISSGKLFAFAKLLKVPIEYFYSTNERDIGNKIISGSNFAEEQADYITEDSVSEKEIMTLIKAFAEINNPQSRKKIIELVKTMV